MSGYAHLRALDEANDRIRQLEQECSRLRARMELAERQYDRLELCSDCRDKATGRCVVCVGEERGRSNVKPLKRALRNIIIHTAHLRPSDGSSYEALLAGLLKRISEIAQEALDA